MEMITGIVDGKSVEILYEGNGRPCSLRVEIVEPKIFAGVLLDDMFPNPLKLSAFLACEIGHGPACDLLHAHGVPRDSDLWHLNHGGWCKPREFADEQAGKPAFGP